ncbi:MAG TPA: NTP transferase domain-containing protein [Gammaproteobacteria bacterium]|nr:NTP transferase domain-containing protein [Gammaproteobacteria bacterium]
MVTNIFIQARMSSRRFPGKVLAHLYNKPLIKHIVDSSKKVNGIHKVVVLTSLEESDDLLSSYLKQLKCDYFRGSLEDVFCRFQSALKMFPCDYFVRLSADSPLLSSDLIEYMTNQLNNISCDIVSNVVIRTFPKGQSIEIAKAKTFMNVNKNKLLKEDCEHVFPYFYRNKNKFKVLSIKNNIDESNVNMCIDTVEDLERLSSGQFSYQFRLPLYVE